MSWKSDGATMESVLPLVVPTPTAANHAATKAYVDGIATAGGGVQSRADKNLPATVTAGDGDAALASGITATPIAGCYVGVTVNGEEMSVGDGSKVGVACYFSGDGGTTARAMNAIGASDTLHWNGSVAGYQLATTDRISLHYEV